MANFYNSSEIEKKINSDWRKKKIVEKLKKRGEGKQKFYFLDGPPFVTNEVHPGTMLGIFIKDAIIRHRQLKGFDVRSQPGWDTHGLPIEVIVEKRLGIKNKKEIKELGEEKFVNACKKMVEEYIKLNTDIMLEYGVLWYNNKPYRTYDNQFMESVWAAVKKADEMGLLYKGFKSTWFCVRCGTPMANYEVRDKYYDKEDTSIFVMFKMDDERYLLVWTTTPWTLPSNVAIAANGEIDYLETEIDGKTVILAKGREKVLEELGIKYEIKKEISGRSLIGLKYKPIFSDIPQVVQNSDRIGVIIDGSKVVSEEGIPFVEMDEGTGLVHSAPGHGESDYKIGMANNLPVLSPVTENGKFTEAAGWLKGEDVLGVNDKIIDYLEKGDFLLGKKKITHKYPHCWRCKTPLIPRASDQWFLNISKIKNELVTVSRGIKWTPDISREMFESWLANAQDWVISRQRYWNTPMPVWQCEKCDNMIVVGGKKELLKLSGKKSIKDLHKSGLEGVEIPCHKCKGKMKRVPDVMDVWMDSGSASFAALGYPGNEKEFKKWFPADFICEGNDQIRGWFYSLLVMGYIMTSKLAFGNVAMHRFVVGENGAKLSKSEGNYTTLPDLLKKGYGRDALRLTLLKHRLEDVVVFTLNGLDGDTKIINVLYNLGNLFMSLKTVDAKEGSSLKLEDKWILSRWNLTKKLVDESLDGFRTDLALNYLTDFIINDFSRTYVKLAKSRIFDDGDAIADATFRRVFGEILPYMSIFAPFISEYLYSLMKKKTGSVMLETLQKANEEEIDPDLERRMEKTMKTLQDILSAREKAKMPVKRPINAVCLPGLSGDIVLEDILLRLGNVLKIKYSVDENDFDVEMNFQSLRGRLQKDEVTSIAAKFIELTKGTILRNMTTGVKVSADGKEFTLTKEDIELKPKVQNLECFDGETSKIIIDKTVTEEVNRLWVKREIIRAVQSARKELGLIRSDKIKIDVTLNGARDDKSISEILPDVCDKTNASASKVGKLLKLQDLNIAGNNIVISIYT